MSEQILQGTMKTLRIGRRIGGRRTLLGLISGAAVSLLVLALMPHPVPSTRSQSLGHRRIQQEEDDYTGPKSPFLPKVDTPRSSGNSPLSAKSSGVLELGKDTRGPSLQRFPESSAPYSDKKEKQEETGVGHVEEIVRKNTKSSRSEFLSQSRIRPNLTITQSEAFPPVDILKTKSEIEPVAKAQETALTALQHGFKLTEGQKKLIEKMSPRERKELEARVSKVRVMQEKAYLQQLRAKKQVRQKQGGGEEIVSTPQTPVRFPATLQKVHPRDWLPQYKIFLNLTHYPWAKISACSNYSITFSQPDTLPTRALASFPSSGNTWIRYLVETATGLFTGSFYDDSSLTKKGMYGEGIVYDSGMTILQKSHGYTTGDAMKLPHVERLSKNHMGELGYRGLVVIRNPFKALISHRHLDTGGHTGYAPRGHFIGEGWAEFVTLKIMLWRDFYVDWLTLSRPEDLHVTFYEHVKDNPTYEMEKILSYLKMSMDPKRLRCVGQHSDGLFKRKPSKNVPLDFDPFTRELKDLVYEAVDEVNRILKLRGKEELPLTLYQFYDSHEAEVARYLRSKRSEGVS